jgi:hypothetical protein
MLASWLCWVFAHFMFSILRFQSVNITNSFPKSDGIKNSVCKQTLQVKTTVKNWIATVGFKPGTSSSELFYSPTLYHWAKETYPTSWSSRNVVKFCYIALPLWQVTPLWPQQLWVILLGAYGTTLHHWTKETCPFSSTSVLLHYCRA